MEEDAYMTAFKLISVAGEAKTKALLSIESSRKGDFGKSEALLKEANELINEAHRIQSKMLSDEADGNPTKVNVILVHAQDHLSMALTTIDMVMEFILLYKKMKHVENVIDHIQKSMDTNYIA